MPVAAATPAYLSWDASSLVRSVANGGTVSRWASSGTNPQAMLGSGVGIGGPVLQYEEGIPQVSFPRDGWGYWAWTATDGPVTLPEPSGSNGDGLTIVIVARMHDVVDNYVRGAGSERLLLCGDRAWAKMLKIHRHLNSNAFDLTYSDGYYPGMELELHTLRRGGADRLQPIRSLANLFSSSVAMNHSL